MSLVLNDFRSIIWHTTFGALDAYKVINYDCCIGYRHRKLSNFVRRSITVGCPPVLFVWIQLLCLCNCKQICLFGQNQTSQTGQLYSDTSHCEILPSQ